MCADSEPGDGHDPPSPSMETGHESVDTVGERVSAFESRDLKPAVTRRDTDRTGGDSIAPDGPPKPEVIDPENAAFVLLGAVSVLGLLAAAIAGI